ncbi:unnamed protein product, partial [Allacma fusca]
MRPNLSDLPNILKGAYNKSAKRTTAQNGFRVSGAWDISLGRPNRYVFKDEEFHESREQPTPSNRIPVAGNIDADDEDDDDNGDIPDPECLRQNSADVFDGVDDEEETVFSNQEPSDTSTMYEESAHGLLFPSVSTSGTFGHLTEDDVISSDSDETYDNSDDEEDAQLTIDREECITIAVPTDTSIADGVHNTNFMIHEFTCSAFIIFIVH